MDNETSTLFIRHLPSDLSMEEKEELLQHFGAIKVRCMPNTGKMKHTAFAIFPTYLDAKSALSRLHQLEILGCRLIVELAKPYHQKHFPHESDFKNFKDKHEEIVVNRISEKEEMRLKMEEFTRRIHAISPNLGLDYLSSPLLKYSYPPPSPSIITNIAHALASVPKFYTQVLHLMNKMNLPAPFGLITQAPPLQPDMPLIEQKLEYEISKEEEIEITSTEESELESDEDDKKKQPTAIKRQIKKQKRKVKKPKIKDLLGTTVMSYQKPVSGPTLIHTDVFEVPSENQALKKIQFNLKPTNELETKEENLNVHQNQQESVHVEEGGFGVIAPHKANTAEEDSEIDEVEDFWKDSKFIKSEELKRNRCSKHEIKYLPAFKNYQPGEPTYRLYIKNLAKQVQEKDLRYIYGRYIDRTSVDERNMFDVRLMKEGRMKGQAFVTLATEKQAIKALDETNAYMLHGKPLVVQFARSARPKDQKATTRR